MIKDGIHYDISPRDYHAWKFTPANPSQGPISNSLLKSFAKSGPYSFRYWTGEKKQTTAMFWGSLVDSMLFNEGLPEGEFVLKELNPHLSVDGAVRNAAAREWRDQKLEEGFCLISSEEKEAASRAVDSLLSTPIVANILEGAKTQVAVVDREHCNVPVKGLLDIVPTHQDHDDSIVDLKTTSLNIYSDDQLGRQVGKYGYHVQAALYLQLWNKKSGDERSKFKIIWQSSTAPYESRVTELDNLWMDAGRAFVRCHLPRLMQCILKASWNSPFMYEETVLPLHTASVFAEEAAMELLSDLEK